MPNVQNKNRCKWVGENPLMIKYHDTEWGVPFHDDKKLYEFFLLDTFQAGLSWSTILFKRDNFRKAFIGFDFRKIAKYTEKDISRLMKDSGIIRNKLKIKSAIVNAQKFLEIQKEFGSFDKYIWQFTGYKTIKNKHTHDSQLRSTSKESELMSQDLKKRGFRFIGSIMCYAFMQGTGMINDHLASCFRYKQV